MRSEKNTAVNAIRVKLCAPEVMSDFLSFMKTEIKSTVVRNEGAAYLGLLLAAVVSARTRTLSEMDDRLGREEFLTVSALVYDTYDRHSDLQEAIESLVNHLMSLFVESEDQGGVENHLDRRRIRQLVEEQGDARKPDHTSERPWHAIVPVAGPTSGQVTSAALRLAEEARTLIERVQERGGVVASLEVSVRSFAKEPSGIAPKDAS